MKKTLLFVLIILMYATSVYSYDASLDRTYYYAEEKTVNFGDTFDLKNFGIAKVELDSGMLVEIGVARSTSEGIDCDDYAPYEGSCGSIGFELLSKVFSSQASVSFDEGRDIGVNTPFFDIVVLDMNNNKLATDVVYSLKMLKRESTQMNVETNEQFTLPPNQIAKIADYEITNMGVGEYGEVYLYIIKDGKEYSPSDEFFRDGAYWPKKDINGQFENIPLTCLEKDLCIYYYGNKKENSVAKNDFYSIVQGDSIYLSIMETGDTIEEEESEEDLEDDSDDGSEDDAEVEIDDNSSDDVDDDSDAKARWIKDCIDDSILRNMNELESKIRRAEAAGNNAIVDELKIKMEALALRIRERTEECKRTRSLNQGAFISEAVKLKNGSASGIVDYYKAKLSEISLEEDEAQRLELLRALRAEIDTEIKTLMESKRQIRSDDMDELVEKIEVRSDKIQADDVEVDSKDRSIITEINGKEVEIKVINGQVKIESEGVEVDTGAITIENNTLFYNGVAIKTLPSDALVRYKLKVKEMELEQKEDRLVYKIKYEENRKILGMFKAKAEHNAEIDTDDGNKLEDNGPWWQWMSTRDGSAETEVETEVEVETTG